MTRLSLKNALVSYEQLAETPSRRDGMSQQKENLIRRYACQLIQSAGILLKSPQVVMATAQVLVNRFYYVSSIYQSDLRAIVLGAFLLASKAEEHPQRISSIITVFDALIKMHRGLTTNVLERHESEYEVMKNEMVEGELQIMKKYLK
ncbi:hypothetical protein H4219_000111 [Mycoemilia scoparia]|uniref:Cyclin N-terminal domain-containing protein n=1 Tax=Mycoemilia scoparia TaxID=417184 RepID=A0A9W8A4H0_9FUNG|nr:hypothetical protein H4219_000111 [Mycoemilia scoparia]